SEVVCNISTKRARNEYVCCLQELNLKAAEVEALLIDLILDRRLYGKIDQIEGFLLLEGSKETSTSRKHVAMERWSNSLRSLTSHVADRVNY
ncbi:unnamed protein product, partial [Laminaria digitata]